jgi:hypothetical protein
MARRAVRGTDAAVHRPRLLIALMVALPVSAAVVVVLLIVAALGYLLDRIG